jgi:hypothetical protein
MQPNGSNQRRQVAPNSALAAFVSPLHLNGYAAIATQIYLNFAEIHLVAPEVVELLRSITLLKR